MAENTEQGISCKVEDAHKASFKAPQSCVVFGQSMSGKTFFAINLLKNSATLFTPKPNRNVVFAPKANMHQYANVELVGAQVQVYPLEDLESFVFEPLDLVIIDEVNSAEREMWLLPLLQHILNMVMHHQCLYVFILMQFLYKSKFFQLLGMAMSVCVSTLSQQSLRLLSNKTIFWDPEKCHWATSLFKKLDGRRNFILYNHNKSAKHEQYFAISHLHCWPHFALVHCENKSAAPEGNKVQAIKYRLQWDGKSSPTNSATHSLSSEIAGELFDIRSKFGLAEINMEGHTLESYLIISPSQLLPLETELVGCDKGRKNNTGLLDLAEESLLRLFRTTLSPAEYNKYRAFWTYLRLCDNVCFDPAKLVLHMNGSHPVPLASFMNALLRRNAPREVLTLKSSSFQSSVVRLLSLLMSDLAFPHHAVKNKLYMKEAEKYLKKERRAQ